MLQLLKIQFLLFYGTELVLDFFEKRFWPEIKQSSQKICKNARFIDVQQQKHFLEQSSQCLKITQNCLTFL